MSATAHLANEHRRIEKVLLQLEGSLKPGKVEAKKAKLALHFFEDFVEKRHIVKEEKILFPTLAGKGIRMLGALMLEHRQEAALTRRIKRFLSNYPSPNKPSIRTSIHHLCELMRRHMWEEEHVLFPTANRVLTDNEQAELVDEFERLEGGASRAAGRDVDFQPV